MNVEYNALKLATQSGTTGAVYKQQTKLQTHTQPSHPCLHTEAVNLI